VLFDMSNVECYKLPVASTCCLLPFDMLLRHVAGVDGALGSLESALADFLLVLIELFSL